MKKFYRLVLSILAPLILVSCGLEKNISYQTVFVPEEGGINFVKVTDENKEQLIVPYIIRDGNRLSWWANPYFAITSNGSSLAYICSRNNNSNIFVKNLSIYSGSQQRTFCSNVKDVAYSPDEQTICYTRTNGSNNSIFLVNATQGSVVRQVSTPGTKDYGPKFSPDGNLIFFTRNDGSNYAIWSHDINTGTLSYYCYGLSPAPINNEEFLCIRRNSQNNYEIWRINYVKGTESIILSQENRSFTTPTLSPDGKWILCAANTPADNNGMENIDIYVVRTDGSQLTQLTYHKGNDLSPVWAPDGKSIYFLSQRGSEKGEYNIWKMNFSL